MSHNEWLRREIGMRYGCLVALTFALSGCIGYSWTTENTDAYSQFSQGVVYELQRTVWVNVDNGHASKNKVFEKSIEVQKERRSEWIMLSWTEASVSGGILVLMHMTKSLAL